MSTQAQYNQWSATYDEVENKTRDLEKVACQQTLADVPFKTVLELGCGTGKNTEWLSVGANEMLCVDLSEGMLQQAMQKIKSSHVSFAQVDMTKPWDFCNFHPDLITCSLVLEHIADLQHIFHQASGMIEPGGWFYICELHPFKQYSGSKARFETEEGLQVLKCFTHHVSDYFKAAITNGFTCIKLDEWFDNNNRSNIPRLLSFLFQKQ